MNIARHPTERLCPRTVIKRAQAWFAARKAKYERDRAADELDALYATRRYFEQREPHLVRVVEEYDRDN